MQARSVPGFLAVAARELDWIRRDRVALVPGARRFRCSPSPCSSLTFSNAVIRDLRVDVVDQDQTRDVDDLRPGDQRGARRRPCAGVRATSTAAMHAVRSGEAIAAVYIPPEFERDIVAGRAAADRHLLQQAVLHAGQHRVRRAHAAVSAGDGRPAGVAAAVRRAITPGPLVVEQYVLTNPALNYAQFLLRAILPTVLHVVDRDRRRLCRRLRVRRAAACGSGWRRPAAVR